MDNRNGNRQLTSAKMPHPRQHENAQRLEAMSRRAPAETSETPETWPAWTDQIRVTIVEPESAAITLSPVPFQGTDTNDPR